LDLRWRLIDLDSNRATLGLDVSFSNVFKPVIDEVMTINMVLFTDVSGTVARDAADEPILQLLVKPFLHSINTQKNNWLGFGVRLGLGLPAMAYQPRFLLTTSQYAEDKPETIEVYDPFQREVNALADRSPKMLRYEIDGVVKRDAVQEWTAAVGMEEERMRYALAHDFDKDTIFMRVGYRRSIHPWQVVDAGFDLSSVTYITSAQSDSRMSLDAKHRYYFWPDVFLDTGAGITKTSAALRVQCLVAIGSLF
jgi:hypothetical protein